MAGEPSRSRRRAFAALRGGRRATPHAQRATRQPTHRRFALVLAASLAIACSSASQQAPGQGWQAAMCEEAGAALLPAIRESSPVGGRVKSATYSRTNLPRADGETAVVLVDVSARIEPYPGTEYDIRRDVGYFENQICWNENSLWGDFYCHAGRAPNEPPGLTVTDEHTRRFLSVLTYLASGGETDAAAIEIAAGRAFQVPMEDLNDKTSAPNHIDRWYYCQSCGNDRAQINSEVSLAGARFGRSANATYFITQSGWAAKLPDSERQASYAFCRPDRRRG